MSNARTSPLIAARQQAALRTFAAAVGGAPVSDDPGERRRRHDAEQVLAGLGPRRANEELSAHGVDGAGADPSTAWRRPLDLPFDLSFLTPGPPRGLTATELVFLIAARDVLQLPGDPPEEPLEARLQPLLTTATRELSTPRGSLGRQLGVLPPRPFPRRRAFETIDGATHFLDFDALLGVERRALPQRGPLRHLLPLVRLRCSAPRCGTPLPAWSPLCDGCGRAVKGERPLR